MPFSSSCLAVVELVPALTSHLTQHATKGSPGKGLVLQFPNCRRSAIPVLTPGPLACRTHRFEATQKRLKSASAQRVEAAEVVAEEEEEALDGGRKEFNGTSLFRFVSEWKTSLSNVLACF